MTRDDEEDFPPGQCAAPWMRMLPLQFRRVDRTERPGQSLAEVLPLRCCRCGRCTTHREFIVALPRDDLPAERAEEVFLGVRHRVHGEDSEAVRLRCWRPP